MDFIEIIRQPWPWWAAGIIIGLTVPVLLLLGNKHFGLSANLRHFCAACAPGNIPFFNYNWKKEMWNFFFVGGTILGAFIAAYYLSDPQAMEITPGLESHLSQFQIDHQKGMVPVELISWEGLFTTRGFIIMILGGFMVGFGARYAGGCTSGHAIMGLSNLQLPSLIATCCFMVGGIIMSWLILPYILNL